MSAVTTRDRPPAARVYLSSVVLCCLLGLGVAGCGASSAVSGAADRAAASAQAEVSARASQAAVSLLTAQVCLIVRHQLSGADVTHLRGLLAQVQWSQFLGPVLTQVRPIAVRGTASAHQLAALRASCAAA